MDNRACLVWLLVAMLALEFGETVKLNISTDFVRCFCNLPLCITSSYMCKSYKGGCFSQLVNQTKEVTGIKGYNGRHGCVDFLTIRNQQMCLDAARNVSVQKQGKMLTKGLICCNTDMCNHVDNPEHINNTASVLGERTENISWSNLSGNQGFSVRADSSEAWFRAAIIAVPICGAVILLVLVVLAVNLLTWDSSKNSLHKYSNPDGGWSPYRHQRLCSDRYYHNNIDSDNSTIVEVVYGEECNTFLQKHQKDYVKSEQCDTINCYSSGDVSKVRNEKGDVSTCDCIYKPTANLKYDYCSNVKRVVYKEDDAWGTNKNLHHENDVPKLYSKETLS